MEYRRERLSVLALSRKRDVIDVLARLKVACDVVVNLAVSTFGLEIFIRGLALENNDICRY